MDNRVSIDSIIRWVAVLALGLTPLVFLPVTQDFYDTNKLTLLAGAACVIAILTGVGYIIHKKTVTWRASGGVTAFGGLLAASVASFIVASTGKVDALMAPLGLIGLLSIAIILRALTRPSEELKTHLTWTLTCSSAILGLISIYQFIGMGRVMFPGIPFVQNSLWTPAGTTMSSIAVYAVTIALLIPLIRGSIGKQHKENTLIFSVAALLVITAGLVITAFEFIPTIPTSLIPISAAWSIMFKSLSVVKAAITGSGVENFVSAYTLGKPASMISTALWNVRFGTNANFFLHITTVYGLVGLAAGILYTWQFVKRLSGTVAIANVVYILFLFLVPPTLTVLTVGAVLLTLSDPGHEHGAKPLPIWMRYIFAGFLLLLGGAGLYLLGRAYIGEQQYFRALTAAQANEGTNTYTLHIAAIQTNPYVARYHITFSQINLSLANAVASIATQQTKDANPNTQSDQNKTLVSQLIQQAISEAKTAVTLNPQSIAAWENLGATYQALMPVALGSDAWAAASYQKALSIDPTNPLLWINLGGVLVHQKKYDDALVTFTHAATLKSDYANAYYNLANALKLKGETTAAEETLAKTMTLVEPGSVDYAKIVSDLDVLHGKTPSGQQGTATPSGQSQLTLPL